MPLIESKSHPRAKYSTATAGLRSTDFFEFIKIGLEINHRLGSSGIDWPFGSSTLVSTLASFEPAYPGGLSGPRFVSNPPDAQRSSAPVLRARDADPSIQATYRPLTVRPRDVTLHTCTTASAAAVFVEVL